MLSVFPDADVLAITVPPLPSPTTMHPDTVIEDRAPLTEYVPAGKYRTPPLEFSTVIALLIADVLLVAPVGSAPKSSTFTTSANRAANVLDVDELVDTTVDGLTGAVNVDPLKVIRDEPASDPELLY